jgi:heme/copper-type cytochrome/quinol oxidase subunit 4
VARKLRVHGTPMNILIAFGLAWLGTYIAVTSVTKNRWGARAAAMGVLTIVLMAAFFGWAVFLSLATIAVGGSP